MACTIGIGRRIGIGELLSASQWSRFRAELRGLVKGCNGEVIAEMEGEGEWEGVNEPCACIVFDESAMQDYHWAALRSILADMAKEYGQDAIALTIGQTEFIKRS